MKIINQPNLQAQIRREKNSHDHRTISRQPTSSETAATAKTAIRHHHPTTHTLRTRRHGPELNRELQSAGADLRAISGADRFTWSRAGGGL